MNRRARTVMTVINTQKGIDPLIQYHRQECVLDVDDTPMVKGRGILQRNYSAVKNQTVTLANGKVISVMELSEAISTFADLWDAEEAAKGTRGFTTLE